ncbi:hypothetical protein THMIRHAM_20750 [Thiomicrorhabdus immobilis]|uniref:AsmA domain-containing protein n=1 Tax=Thiomicrorhabdus immobilis TaxID=2791037 RepID=A0ABN6D2D0_9GAMM|nr:AsmA family protein [Thiomicrorhabdus immobilis]BCN94290.1 hypothetical protein THMIRHAM_20750 [Thiomicrorhabdus immobilis]
MTQATLKWTKRAALILAIIPILLFLGFAGAVSLIDFNQYKPQIEQEVAKLTKRDFKIEGEVKVSVLPFMFHLGKMTLKNQPGFEEENLFTMKEAQIELSLKTLFLDKKLKVTSLELIEPKFHFIELADRNNWSDMPLLSFVDGMPQRLVQQVSQITVPVKVSKIAVGESVGGFQKVAMGNEPALLKTSVQSSQSSVSEKAPLEQKQPDWSLESLVVKNAEIIYSNSLQGFSVSLKKANLLAFDVLPNKPFKMNSDFVYQHSQSPRTFDFQINGNILLANHYTQLHLSNWHGVFRLRLPEVLNKPDIRLTTEGENLMVDFKYQQLYVKNTKLEGLEAQVLASFQGEFGVNPVYDGVFEAEKINLKKWIEHLGLPAPEMVKTEALTNASGKFNWHWNGKVLSIKKLDAKVDDTQILGSLSWPFNRQAAEFDLVVNNLNMDDFMVKVDLPAIRPGDLTHNTQNTQETHLYPIPMAVLQELNASGKLQFNSLTFQGLKLPTVDMQLLANSGNWEIAPLDIQFAQGQLQSKLMAELASNRSDYVWKGRTKDLALGGIVNSGSNGAQQPQGVLDSHFLLKTSGVNPQQWLAHLQGSVNADFKQIKLSGLDINQILSGSLELTDNNNAFTHFKHIEVMGQISDGIFTPKRLLLQSERFKGTGHGTLDLRTQQIEGDLLLTVAESTEVLAGLRGLSLPVKLEGGLAQPNWSINVAELNPKMAQNSASLSAITHLLQ